tara:strand:- start:1430 stop:2182 length:753 start_codon:yes stop_codon:yes gene_type:complete
MAVNEFFTVEVSPIFSTNYALLHSAALADNDVMFDWHEFEIPRGTYKLVNVMGRVRGNNGTKQNIAHELFFANEGDKSLGTYSSAQAGIQWLPHIQAHLMVDADDYSAKPANCSIYNIGQSANKDTGRTLPTVLQPAKKHIDAGYSKMYVGGLSGGAFDFGTGITTTANVLIGDTTITIGGGGGNNAFLPGDVIADQNGVLYGTIASVGDAALTLQDATVGDGAVGDVMASSGAEVHIANPITLVLQFER